MNDGTTAIPVSPAITEDDMNKLQTIFQRALDAIVGMSKLASEVEVLRSQVAQLTDDAERLRRANAGLDESLYQARNQRLDLERKLAEAEQAKATAQRECNDWQSRANQASEQYHIEKDTCDKLTKERDDAQYQVLELQDKLKAAEAKITSIHSALGIAVPQEPTPPPPMGSVVLTPPPAPAAPEASPTPEPSYAPPVEAWGGQAPTRTYFDQWQPGSSWDDEKRQYYTEH